MKPAHVHRLGLPAAKAKPPTVYASPKLPGAAPPPTRSWQPAPKHDADLAWPVPRDGADDALGLQSKGDRT